MTESNLPEKVKVTPEGGPEVIYVDRGLPWLGLFSVGFGIAGIFTWGVVFVPLGFIFSVLALLFGQVLWGMFGLLLALVGFATSPMLWAIVGLGWLAAWFGMPMQGGPMM